MAQQAAPTGDGEPIPPPFQVLTIDRSKISAENQTHVNAQFGNLPTSRCQLTYCLKAQGGTVPKPGPRVWGVLFTEQALQDLESTLGPYLRTGQVGKYLYCKQVEMDLPHYCRIVIENINPDKSKVELEFFVPHHYIRSVVAATEQKTLGFV